MFALHQILQEEYARFKKLKVSEFRVIARDRGNPFQALTEEEFIERYRLNKDAVSDLLDELRPVAPRIVNGRGM